MNSRNALREDFVHIVSSMEGGLINAENYITHRVKFDQVKHDFESWLTPEAGVIKAIVELA